jgi:multidrug efflux system outer membrane protein
MHKLEQLLFLFIAAVFLADQRLAQRLRPACPWKQRSRRRKVQEAVDEVQVYPQRGTCARRLRWPHPPVPSGAAVTPPVQWRAELGPVAAIERQWWKSFGDPVLTQLVEQALAHNDNIAIAAARVREARAQEEMARAQRIPTLGHGVNVGPSRSVSGARTPVTQTIAQPLFQASYELDLFGRVGDQVRAAEQATVAAQAPRDATMLSIASATATGYITLRGLDAQADFVHATIIAREEALHSMRDQTSSGYVSQLELRQSEAEYQAAVKLLPQTQLAITREENALSVLIGTSPRAIKRGSALTALRPPPVADWLPSTRLRRRPDVAQAEAALAATDANLALARSQFLPSIGLTASSGAAFSSALASPIALWSAGASVLAPIFEGGRLRGGVNQAAARRGEPGRSAAGRGGLCLPEHFPDGFPRGRGQPGRGSATLRTARRTRIAACCRSNTLRHATSRYRAGYTSHLEQLVAQRGLLEVKLSLAQLSREQLTTTVALYQAMGGGWSGIGSFDTP